MIPPSRPGTGTGEEQELIEDVENLQVTYGIDNITTNPDGTTPDLTGRRGGGAAV